MHKSKEMNLKRSTFWHWFFLWSLWILVVAVFWGMFSNCPCLKNIKISVNCEGLGSAIGTVGIISFAFTLVNQFRKEYTKGVLLGRAMDETYPHYMQFLVLHGLFVATGVYAGKAGHLIVCMACAIGVLICIIHTAHILWRLSPGVNRRDRFVWAYIDGIRKEADKSGNHAVLFHYVQLAAKDIARRLSELEWAFQITEARTGSKRGKAPHDAEILKDMQSLCRLIASKGQEGQLDKANDLPLLQAYTSFFSRNGHEIAPESVIYMDPSVDHVAAEFRANAFLCVEFWRSALSEASNGSEQAMIAYSFFKAVEAKPAAPILCWGLVVYLYHQTFSESKMVENCNNVDQNTPVERCATFIGQLNSLHRRDLRIEGKKTKYPEAITLMCWDMTILAIYLSVSDEMLFGQYINNAPLQNLAFDLLYHTQNLDTAPLSQKEAFYKYFCFAFLGHSFDRDIYCTEMIDCVSDAFKMIENYLKS